MKLFSRLRLISSPRGTNPNLNLNGNRQQRVGTVAGEEEEVTEEEDGYETAVEVSSSSRIGIRGNRSSSSSSGEERNGEMEDTSSSSSSSPGEVKVKEEGESSEAVMSVTNTQVPATSSPGVEEDARRNTDNPPTDDCCPICFGGFVVPCRAPCGHWYCGMFNSVFYSVLAI